jgi:hypothetical protein
VLIIFPIMCYGRCGTGDLDHEKEYNRLREMNRTLWQDRKCRGGICALRPSSRMRQAARPRCALAPPETHGDDVWQGRTPAAPRRFPSAPSHHPSPALDTSDPALLTPLMSHAAHWCLITPHTGDVRALTLVICHCRHQCRACPHTSIQLRRTLVSSVSRPNASSFLLTAAGFRLTLAVSFF